MLLIITPVIIAIVIVIIFSLICVSYIFKKNIDPINDKYLFSEFEVSYIFLPTNAIDEVNRVKGFDYKRNLTVTTIQYPEVTVKIGDTVKYKYVVGQVVDVELV